jgi:hypothetical protein
LIDGSSNARNKIVDERKKKLCLFFSNWARLGALGAHTRAQTYGRQNCIKVPRKHIDLYAFKFIRVYVSFGRHPIFILYLFMKLKSNLILAS